MVKPVLLVDDEEEIVNFLENFLRRFKIPSIKTTSGEEAIALYSKERIGFIFLDIQMEGIDGLSVLKELKKTDPSVKVIFITGRGEKELYEKTKKLGAIDYITKPLDLRELKEKIDKYILR
ncbi:MAG: response regulator [Candidatus Omnitrophica bacterium]|nr:response regulator [Candidatus Omnitrophota bacterium]